MRCERLKGGAGEGEGGGGQGRGWVGAGKGVVEGERRVRNGWEMGGRWVGGGISFNKVTRGEMRSRSSVRFLLHILQWNNAWNLSLAWRRNIWSPPTRNCGPSNILPSIRLDPTTHHKVYMLSILKVLKDLFYRSSNWKTFCIIQFWLAFVYWFSFFVFKKLFPFYKQKNHNKKI